MRGFELASETQRHVARWATAQPGSITVVELGSGAGTPKLREQLRPHQLISVEHNPRFRDYCDVFAPLKNKWYHRGALRAGLPETIDLVIVDGPPGTIGRSGLLDNLDMFPPMVPMLLDDVNRDDELRIAMWLSRKRGQPLTIYPLPQGRAYAALGMT